MTPQWLAQQHAEELATDRLRRGTGLAVDLGLSVCWANYNLGAKSEEQTGYMEAWTNVSGCRDAARDYWAEGWRLPTKGEFQELMQQCQWNWTAKNGMPGFWIVGSTGNGIFLPACGTIYSGQHDEYGVIGHYWCSESDSNDNERACAIEFSQQGGDIMNLMKTVGICVRPVTLI